MFNILTRGRLAVLAAGTALTASVPALAQAAAAEATSRADEIVVTAQKREERLQDVPISISVVSPEQLAAFAMNEATDLQYVVPGLTLINASSTRNSGFFVRGIGTSSFSSESIEGSTAFVVDGVVLGQSGASFADLPDIERIEVLRGPQGTLFGKNASAGVVNVTTRDPGDEFEGKVSGSWAWPNDDRRIAAYIGGPIAEGVGFTLSGRINKRDGYVKNLADDRVFNGRDEWGVRGKLKLEPVDGLSLMVTGDYYKRDAACCIWTLRDIPGVPSVSETLSLIAGIEPGRDNLEQNIGGELFSKNEIYGTALQADYALGDYMLTSITAWRGYRSFDNNDADSSPIDLLDVNYGRFRQRQFTQELRLASPVGGTVDYVVGLFYFDAKVYSRSVQRFPTLPFPFFNKEVDNRARTRNAAIFGQANIHITDDFRLIAGGRLLHEKAEASKDRFDFALNLTSSAEAKKSDTALVWRGGLQYDFTDDIMAFATVTRGYKGGGYDTNIGLATLPDVEPERPTNIELGLRTAFPGAGLIFNLTAFHTKVAGYQASARDAGPPPVTRILNGEAKTQGIEADFAWRPSADADWSIYGSAALIDGAWGDFANAPCYSGQTAAQGCVGEVQDLTGARLPWSSRFSGNIATNFTQPLSGDLKLVFDLGLNYRSSQVIAFPNDPRALQKGFALVNASVALAGGEAWRVSLFGKNLTDKRYSIVDFTTPLGSPGSYSQFIPYEAQRVIGLSAEFGF
ncbi:MAG TPA: TonB-dependent receptor [Sphingopyxis sp.]|nr:TonB-dependent receptor [Sphingopyxis sp.]